jgi:hypothetical protein
MSFDHIALAGLIIGFCIGLTGMGGGALMTPVLVLGFGIQPSAAVSSDILASAIMKPFGSAIHFHRGNVHLGLVRWLTVGSVPAAFAGVFVNGALGEGAVMQERIQFAMGAALLLAVGAIVAKIILESVRPAPEGESAAVEVKRLRTVAIGAIGGLLVGMTSVGAGTVIIVLLMLVYPRLPMRQIVGTDLVQAIPLVAAAAASHALFGDLQFALTTSLTFGGIIGVVLGALLSSRAPNRFIRPALAYLLIASALKLLKVPTVTVGLVMLAVAVVGLVLLVVAWRRKPARAPSPVAAPARPLQFAAPVPRPPLRDHAEVTD